MPLRTWEPRLTGDDTELDEIIGRFTDAEGAMIPLLQAVQEARGYLSEEALTRISARTGLPVSRLIGVATFYAQFRLAPVGKYVIRVCQGTACHVAGSSLIEQALEDELDIADGETTQDGLFTLSAVACLGCCSLAPAILVGTDLHARMTPDNTRRLVRRIRKKELASDASGVEEGKP